MVSTMWPVPKTKPSPESPETYGSDSTSMLWSASDLESQDISSNLIKIRPIKS